MTPKPTIADWHPIETVPIRTHVLSPYRGGVRECFFESPKEAKAMNYTHWAPMPAPPPKPDPFEDWWDSLQKSTTGSHMRQLPILNGYYVEEDAALLIWQAALASKEGK